MKRSLPRGGRLKEDYVFDEGGAGTPDRESSDLDTVRQTRFSELFAEGKDSLVVYSFMYPQAGTPCPICTAMLDGLDGNAQHIAQRVNLAVVAKAPIRTIREWGLARGWRNLRLLSSAHNTYNADYFAETPDGNQWPALNVFHKTGDGIRHFYNTELLYTPPEEGQDPRHVDLIWPLWNVFDLTPDGRGTTWYPSVSYDESSRSTEWRQP